jgi:hypothetical protein
LNCWMMVDHLFRRSRSCPRQNIRARPPTTRSRSFRKPAPHRAAPIPQPDQRHVSGLMHHQHRYLGTLQDMSCAGHYGRCGASSRLKRHEGRPGRI